MKASVIRLINKSYQDIAFPYAFGSYRKFSESFLRKHPHLKLTYEDIKDVLLSNQFYALHKGRKTRFERRTMTRPPGPGIFFAMDIAIMPTYKKYKYILVMIDAYSRFVIAHSLKSKSKDEIKALMDDIILKNKLSKLTTLTGDKESAFMALRSYWKEKHIFFFPSLSDNKAFLAENAIKNLKSLLRKYLKYTDDENWPEALPKVVEQLNQRPKKTLNNLTSRVLNDPLNAPYLDKLLPPKKEGKLNKKDRSLKVNDYVFVDLDRKFAQFSLKQEDIQRVAVRQIAAVDKKRKPYMFMLKTLKGVLLKKKFYASQLQKTLPTRRNRNIEYVLDVKRKKSKVSYLVEDSNKKTFWVDEKYLIES